MDPNGQGREKKGVDVVILSGACCNPSLGGMDDQAKRLVEQAAAAAGVEARIKKQSMVTALYGGVPKEVADQLRQDSRSGGLRMPVVIVNGKGVSYGAPDAEKIAAAIRAMADAAV